MSTVTTSAGAARPRALKWWGNASLSHLRQRLEAVLTEFDGAWGVACTVQAVSNAGEAGLSDTLQWATVPASDSGCSGIWAGCASSPTNGLRRAMFGHEDAHTHGTEDSIANDVATAAWLALATGLRAMRPQGSEAGSVPVTAYPEAQRKPWSGAVVVVLCMQAASDAEVVLHLDPRVVSELVDAAPKPASPKPPRAVAPLVPVTQAIGRQPLDLAVTLSSIELDLGSLLGLRAGDTVTIPHALTKPVNLSIRRNDGIAGDVISQAYLGAQRGVKAIELLATAERPSSPHH
jgi:hypothetical protein